ncbi:pilus assembly protein [soil metagenome]
MSRRPAPLLSRFLRDERGVSILEFSFIAPVMILMFFGIAELGQGLVAQRRTQHIASAIGDLTAQASSVSSGDTANIFDAGQQIMAPLPITGLTMRLTSVTTNASSVPKVDWSDARNISANTVGATYALPSGLTTGPSQTVIVSEATYNYSSPVKYVLPNGMQFSLKSYLVPRTGTVTHS